MGGLIFAFFAWAISMLVFYWIIKEAVRDGVIEAHKVINESKRIS